MNFNDTAKKAIAIAAHMGLTIVDIRPICNHPDDQHLAKVVVHKTPEDPTMFARTNFIGYFFNAAVHCDGFFGGHYDMTLKQAGDWMENNN
jgi:hypothetical protein